MTIQKFEYMKVWQDARSIVNQIYKSTSIQKFKQDFGVRDQFQRASVSIISNIAEGYEGDSNKELVRFLHYSKGSAGEVRSLLYVANDHDYLTEQEFAERHAAAVSIIKQISNFIKYLKQRTEK